ncbi:uncharacterized protein [Kogia breviceps]|uniref:uncharacterized protein isoform X1 n=1 Tax=Kogia breviceps TaxID=27615 RepID=UPI0034D1D31C
MREGLRHAGAERVKGYHVQRPCTRHFRPEFLERKGCAQHLAYRVQKCCTRHPNSGRRQWDTCGNATLGTWVWSALSCRSQSCESPSKTWTYVAHSKRDPPDPEALSGTAPVVQGLTDQGLIRPGQWASNNSILPVKKPRRENWMAQDLAEINEAAEDTQPVVPYPYILLTTLPSTRTWYSVLHLKDAFFCIPLAPESQEFFAFERQDPNSQRKPILLDSPAPGVQKIHPPSLGTF